MLFSKVEVLPARQSNRHRAIVMHGTVVGVVNAANAGPALIIIQCAQTIHFCYYVQTLIVNVFVAFAAKLHFTCILSLLLVSPSWLQGLLLSTERVKI